MTEIQDAAFVGLNIDQWQVEEALPALSGSGKDRFFMARRSGASRIMQFVPESSIHERLFSWQPRDARFEWLSNDDATRAGIMPLRLASSIAVRGQTFLVLGFDAMNLGGSRWLADMLTRPADRAELSLDDFLLMARAVCGALDYLGSNGKSLAHCNVRPSAVLFLPELTPGEGRFRVFRTGLAYRMDCIPQLEQTYYLALCEAKRIEFGDSLWKGYNERDDSKCLYRLLSSTLHLVAAPEREYEQLLRAINQELRNRNGSHIHKDLAFQKAENLKIVTEIRQIDASARVMVQRTQGVAIKETVRHIGKLMECKDRLKEILKDGRIPNELVTGILKGAFPDLEIAQPPALESVEPAEISDQKEPTRIVVRGRHLLGISTRFTLSLEEKYVRPVREPEDAVASEGVSLAIDVLQIHGEDDAEDVAGVEAPAAGAQHPASGAPRQWVLEADPEYAAKKDSVGLIVPVLDPGRYRLSADGGTGGLEIQIRESVIIVPAIRAVRPKTLEDVTRSETIELIGVDLDALGDITLLDAKGAEVQDPSTRSLSAPSPIMLSRPEGADEDRPTRAFRTVPALQQEGSFELAHNGRPTGVFLQVRAKQQQYERLSPDAIQNDSPRIVELIGRQLRRGAAFSLVATDNSTASTVDGQPAALEVASYAPDRIGLKVPERVRPGSYRVLCEGQDTKLGLVVDPAVTGFEPRRVCLRNAIGRRRRSLSVKVVGGHFDAGAGAWALVGKETVDLQPGTTSQSPELQLPVALSPGEYRLRIGEREFAPTVLVKRFGTAFFANVSAVALVVLAGIWTTIHTIVSPPVYEGLDPAAVTVHLDGTVLDGASVALRGRRLDPNQPFHLGEGNAVYLLTATGNGRQASSSSIFASGDGLFDRLEFSGLPARLPNDVATLVLDKGIGLKIAINRVGLDGKLGPDGDAIEADATRGGYLWTEKGTTLCAYVAGQGLDYLKEHGNLVLQKRSDGQANAEAWEALGTDLNKAFTVEPGGAKGSVDLARFVPREGQRATGVKLRLVAEWGKAGPREELPAFDIHGSIKFQGVCEDPTAEALREITTYRKAFYLVFASGQDSRDQLEYALQQSQGYELLICEGEPGPTGNARAVEAADSRRPTDPNRIKLTWFKDLEGPMKVIWHLKGAKEAWSDSETIVDARLFPAFSTWKVDGASTIVDGAPKNDFELSADKKEIELSIRNRNGDLVHNLSISGLGLGTVEQLTLVAPSGGGGPPSQSIVNYQHKPNDPVSTDIALTNLRNEPLLNAESWALHWSSSLPAPKDADTGLRIKVRNLTVVGEMERLVVAADAGFVTPAESTIQEDPAARTSRAVGDAEKALELWNTNRGRLTPGDLTSRRVKDWTQTMDRMRFYVFFDLAYYQGRWASAYASTFETKYGTFETPYYKNVRQFLNDNTYWILANKVGSPPVRLEGKDDQAAWVNLFAIAWQSYLNLEERDLNKPLATNDVSTVTQALQSSYQSGESRIAPALLGLLKQEAGVAPGRAETVYANARGRLDQPVDLEAASKSLARSNPLFYLMLLLAVDKSPQNTGARVDLAAYEAASPEFPERLHGLMRWVKQTLQQRMEQKNTK